MLTRSDLDPTNFPHQALDLMAFVIHTFRLNEDEVSRLHAPVIAFALLDLVAQQSSDRRVSALEDTLLALNISLALLKETSSSFFNAAIDQAQTSTIDAESDEVVSHTQAAGIETATSFYSARDNKSARVPGSGYAGRLISNGISVLLRLVEDTLTSTVDANEEVSLAAMQLLAYLLEVLPRSRRMDIAWEPRSWLSRVVGGLTQTTSGRLKFDLLDNGVQILLALSDAPIQPTLALDLRGNMAPLVHAVRWIFTFFFFDNDLPSAALMDG